MVQPDVERRHEGGLRLTRAQALAAGAGLVLAAVPAGVLASPGSSQSYPFFPAVKGTYTSEQVQDVLNTVATTRYLVAGFVFFAIKSGTLSGPALVGQQAGAARVQYEIDFLSSIGASPLATVATLDPKILANPNLTNQAQLGTINIFISMEVTAIRELAELGQPVLAKWMAQLLVLDGAAAASIRAAAGDTTNYAFAPEFFLYTRDALAALRGISFLGGPGIPAAYPGRDAMLAAAGPFAASAIQRSPNDATSSVVLNSFADISTVLGERK
jgi:hypothetical protein